jgi:hypothetical protein
VRVAGTEREIARLALSLDELLGRLALQVVVEPYAGAELGQPRATQALARVSIDLTQPDRAVCTMEDNSGTVRMDRRAVMRTGSRSILLDEVAHVVQAAVENLLAERTAAEQATADGSEPAALPAPTASDVRPEPGPPPTGATVSVAGIDGSRTRSRPVPMPRSEEPPAWGLDIAALLGLHAVADTALLVAGGAVATHVAYRRGALHPGGWISAEYRLPFDIDQSSLPPQAQTVALRALPAVDFYHRRPWALGVALGGGIDVFRVDHGFEEPGEPPTRLSATRVVPVLASFFTARHRLAENVELVSLWGFDLDLRQPDLEVRRDRRPGIQPWRMRPGLMLGIAFTPLGAEPFD